jgi:hypothetical protein
MEAGPIPYGMRRAINIQPGEAGAADVVPATEKDSASQMFCADLARLITAIRDAAVPEKDKEEARAKLAEFFKTPAAGVVLRGTIPHLMGLLDEGPGPTP